MIHSAGERLFSRYAYSPNELGYCGPAGAAGLAAVARGDDVDFEVRPVASQFSGAWVYQLVIGRMLGRDPLDEQVVRGYWTGNALTDGIDRDEFWRRLITIIGPRAGDYWKHLDDPLAEEATPSHAFHVLGVYPWSRMLDIGRPEPISVLESCCIRLGRVTGVDDGRLTLAERAFVYRGGRVEQEDTVRSDVPALFDPDVAPGDLVAVHWGVACDRLSAEEAAALTRQLDEQLELLNARLARA